MKNRIQAPAGWLALAVVAVLASTTLIYNTGTSFSHPSVEAHDTVATNARLTPSDLLW